MMAVVSLGLNTGALTEEAVTLKVAVAVSAPVWVSMTVAVVVPAACCWV